MPSRALLLTADEATNGLLQQALADVAEVRRCKEIFAAVEEITQTSFQLLLIDWHDELESNFLVQTARDLKSNRSVFAVALVTQGQARAALEGGADAVLIKPLTVEQAAEMLLPRLGVEYKRKDAPSPEPESQKAPAIAESAPLPLEAKPAEARPWLEPAKAIWEPRRVNAERSPFSPQSPPAAVGGTRFKLSPFLSSAAIAWPLVIAAALLAFDQWPHSAHSGAARLSAAVDSTHARMNTLPSLTSRLFSSSGSEPSQLPQAEPALPVSGDLLADYASPSPPTQVPNALSLVPPKPEEVDMASVEALPSSTRIVPVVSIAQPAPRQEIPASLRYPPVAQSAAAVAPATGQLIAPDWADNTIALPEAVTRALLESQVPPQYPERALRAGLDGTVVLQASIGKDGRVRDLKLVSGYLVLARAACDAVKQWRYKPYKRNGESVEVETVITVNFKQPPRG